MPNRIKKHKEKTKRAETAGGLAMDIWPPKLLENHLFHWKFTWVGLSSFLSGGWRGAGKQLKHLDTHTHTHKS